MKATTADTSRAPFGNIDDKDLARLRKALVADREAQTALVMEHDATARALTGQRDVDSILEREMAEGAAARSRDAVKDIDAALTRMTTDTYGLCESCSSPIAIARLEAIPRARFCVACSD